MEYEKILTNNEELVDYKKTVPLNEHITFCFIVYPEENELNNEGYVYKVNETFYHVRRKMNGKISVNEVDIENMMANVPLYYPVNTEKVLPEVRNFAVELIKYIQNSLND